MTGNFLRARNAGPGGWALAGVMTEEWRTLAAAAAAGDLPARDRLVALSAVPARRAARRLVDDPDALDDVVKDALVVEQTLADEVVERADRCGAELGPAAVGSARNTV